MLYLFFLLSDALTSGDIGSYELIRTETCFTLYDNATIRRAKIELTFPTTILEWKTSGISIGSILPCNPTNYIDLCCKGYPDTSQGQEIVRVMTSGYLYGFGAYSNTTGYGASRLDRSGYNGTYYWTY